MANLNEELLQVPKILYKYITWNKEHHRKILLENEIYFSSFDQFNDPFEGEYPYRFRDEDLTDENIIEYYYQLSLKNGENYTKEFLWKHLDRNILKHTKYWEQIHSHRPFIEQIGIFCLSVANNNQLMWSHYANSHQGLCIGFNLDKLHTALSANLRKVKYSKDFPRMPLFPKSGADYIPFLYTKSKDGNMKMNIDFLKLVRLEQKSIRLMKYLEK